MIETRSYCLDGLAFPIVHEPAGASRAHSERDVLELLRARKHALLGELHRRRRSASMVLLRGRRAFHDISGSRPILSLQAATLPSRCPESLHLTSYPASAPIALHTDVYFAEYPSLIAFYFEIPPRWAARRSETAVLS